jgi:hypothetical protein
MGFVEFRGHGLLNGIQEVVGSIPISSTRKPLSNQRLAVLIDRVDAPRRGG